MSDLEQRIRQIETRLNTIETILNVSHTMPTQPEATVPKAELSKILAPHQRETQPPPQLPHSPSLATKPSWSVTNVLGWSGATALVLAALYIIVLAYDSGWLTPTRQIFFAVLGAAILIGLGLLFRRSNPEYASLLPAAGIVILFLSIYGAHLYYHLISSTRVSGIIVMVCLTSLWLCWRFKSQLFALFAVVGSYSAPFLLPALNNEIVELFMYYSAWSLLFCGYAIWVKSRPVYLLAMYMGVIGFILLCHQTSSEEWIAVSIFQAIQFMIFVICTLIYSIQHKAPMNKEIAMVHAPALLIFYYFEYAILAKNIPISAPWIAVASACLFTLTYNLVRKKLNESLEGAWWLLNVYLAAVLLHAVYLESVPSYWAPWVALVLVFVAAIYGWVRQDFKSIGWPIGFVIGLIFLSNIIRIVSGYHLTWVAEYKLLIILYALTLYIGYYVVHQYRSSVHLSIPLIYGGHVLLMVGLVHIFDEPFSVSLAWGIFAIACLFVALKRKDKMLGQSSLFVFFISVAKVLLYDLTGTDPLTRIFCLLILGITLYIGGWLFKKVNQLEPAI